jgi:ribosomal protein S18 acetylase RimI-like enzyme
MNWFSGHVGSASLTQDVKRTEGEQLSCRDATHADLPILARVHIAAWRKAYRGHMDPAFLESLGSEHALSRLRSALEPRPPLVVVVEHESEVVGFSRFGPSRDTDVSAHAGEVFACNVDPRHWRRGFGAQFMSAALSRLAVAGHDTCTLWVLEKNERATRFYSALGFNPDGAIRVEAADTAYPLREIRYRRPIAGAA